MKKMLLYGAGACATLAAAAALGLYLEAGAVAKAAVETWGPRVARTDVRVASASLSPFSGRGRIKGLFIGNPPGFKTPCAVRVGSVRVAVDLKSLRGRRVLVKEIVVESPEVDFEGGPSGSNLSRIQKNTESFAPALKVEIGLFKVTNGKVHLSLTALGGRSLTLPLPDIELHDIGRSSGGVTVGEAVKEMFGALTGAATRTAAGAGSLLKSGADQLEKAGQAATGLIQRLFGRKRQR